MGGLVRLGLVGRFDQHRIAGFWLTLLSRRDDPGLPLDARIGEAVRFISTFSRKLRYDGTLWACLEPMHRIGVHGELFPGI